MDTLFMNSENIKTSEPPVLILKLTDKLDLGRSENIALSNLSIYYAWKNIKKTHAIAKILKYLPQHGMINLNYLIDLILYQIFKIILNTFQKTWRKY